MATISSGSTSLRWSSQAFVTSRLVKHQGLRGALLALPLIALGGYAIVAAGVGFAVVRWVKTAENATDYSIMNTARQLLWLPTSREEKYKAKQAIDTFFMRGGDLLSAGFVFVGTSVLQLGVGGFAAVNVRADARLARRCARYPEAASGASASCRPRQPEPCRKHEYPREPSRARHDRGRRMRPLAALLLRQDRLACTAQDAETRQEALRRQREEKSRS